MALFVVGLGNPDAVYAETRHNAGFKVVDRVAARMGCSFRKPFLRRYRICELTRGQARLILVKPLTYMNRSGEILKELLAKTGCSISDLLVVCDNLDLPVGICRLKRDGSSGGHNGLASIIAFSGSSSFKRLYIGIGRPDNGRIIDHVLGIPPASERKSLDEAVDAAADGVIALLDQPIDRVMNGLNQRRA